MMIEGKLSVVMPAYNEGTVIYRNAVRTLKTTEKFCAEVEIVIVNDGSTDQTREEAQRACRRDPRIRLVSYRTNGGKGKAIRRGVQAADGDYIAFLDADLDLPPDQLRGFLRELSEGRADAVIGSKMHPASHIDYPWMRRVISVGYACMLRLLFHLDVRDTQTGIKAFCGGALREVIGMIRTDGYAYDIEILVALHCRGYRILEMPVRLIYTGGMRQSRIGLQDILRVFADTLRIFLRAYIFHDYR